MSISVTGTASRQASHASLPRATGNSSLTLAIKGMALASLAALYAAGWMDFKTLVSACVVATFLDIKNPLLTKNIFLAYAFCLFIVAGNYYLPDADDLFTDMLVYVALYLVGYHYVGLAGGKRRHGFRVNQPPSRREVKHIRLIEKLVGVYVLVPLVLLAMQVQTYGLGDFFQGAALEDSIESYANAGLAIGPFALIKLCAGLMQTALCVYYVCRCLRVGTKPRLDLLAVLLVATPLLSLNRSSAVQGCVFLAIVALFGIAGSWLRMARRFLVLAICGFVAICGAIAVGQLRMDRLTSGTTETLSTEDRLLQVICGEFSPIILYHDVKQNIDSLGYRYGAAIALPLLFKPFPRRWVPNKPENTSMIYMRQFRSSEFDAGYSLAPSIFGDIYLNFGWYGCLAVSAMLGCVSGRLDRVFVLKEVSGFPTFLLVHSHFFALLRNNTGDSIALLLFTAVSYIVVKHALDPRPWQSESRRVVSIAG